MINIAIDGPSAAGKSTIAKLLATKLSYIHIDTGAMYRCFAYATLLYNVDINNMQALQELTNEIKITFDSLGNILLDGVDVSDKIRSNEISMRTSTISRYSFIREKMVAIQKEVAKDKGYILDGRDIGTVVLPDAEVKIFLVASVKMRATRRYEEYVRQGVKVNYEDIYKDIEDRDYQDTHREISPLKKAKDAIEIDTSSLTIGQVIDKVLALVLQKIKDVAAL